MSKKREKAAGLISDVKKGLINKNYTPSCVPVKDLYFFTQAHRKT